MNAYTFSHLPDSLRNKENEKIKTALLQTGFIAQEVEQAANELHFDFSGVDKPKNKKDMYGLRYPEFVVPLVKAVQELDEKNKLLEQEIILLKKQNEEILGLLKKK